MIAAYLLSGVIDSVAAQLIVDRLVEAGEIEFAVSEELRDMIESEVLVLILEGVRTPYSLDVSSMYIEEV